MKRRTFLGSLGLAGTTALAGCASFLDGGSENSDSGGFSDVEESDDISSDFISRVDFIDNTNTLGQVAHYQNSQEKSADNLVNDYTEEDWQRMDGNDLDVARNKLQHNDSSIEEIRPWVERALNRNLDEPEIESMDSPPGPEEPDERAIMYGIGRGIQSESLITNSIEAANTLKPLAEKFASEYLENDAFEAWITPATLSITNGEFVHLPLSIAYNTENGFNIDYVEDGVPDTPGLPESGESIRSAGNSVYDNPDLLEYLTGFEYEKALQASEEGMIEPNGDLHPNRAISNALLVGCYNMVDSSQNDLDMAEVPPNGLVTHASKEFGRSMQDALDNLDQEKLQYMKNIGRGVKLFYEEKGGSSNLAVGGTLEEPEFYEFPDGMKDKLWNFNYDSLSALEG